MLPIAAADFDIRERIWLGTTAENQEEYDRRWPYIAAQRAAVRFVSYEPALGPLCVREHKPRPDWVICGGESGPNARPMKPYWRALSRINARGSAFRSSSSNGRMGTRSAQTGVTGTGLHPRHRLVDLDGPAGAMYRVGKKRAGRLLDGREWNEMPA